MMFSHTPTFIIEPDFLFYLNVLKMPQDQFLKVLAHFSNLSFPELSTVLTQSQNAVL